MRVIVLFLAVMLVMSCKSDKVKNSEPTVSVQDIPKGASKFDLESLPESEILRLYNEATYVDYIFYDLPFSLSQDNKPSIHSNLKMISSLPMDFMPTTCKPIGREFFHIGGEIVHEADLYFSKGCIGYVFLKDQKPIYANKLTEGGMKFYANIISQSQKMANQAVNGQ